MVSESQDGKIARLTKALETALDSAGNLKQMGGGYGLATVLPGPKAYPVGALLPEPVYLPNAGAPVAHVPDSLGPDGNTLYGHTVGAGGAMTKLWSSADGLGTITYGADLSTLTGPNALLAGEIIGCVVKTWQGVFVTVVNTSGTESGGIYYSTSFSSGFTRVKTTGVSLPKMPMTVHHGKNALYSIYIVGEYSQVTNYLSQFFISIDGGATWTALQPSMRTIVAPGINSHCHASCVDRRSGRIYLSFGDGNNRGFYYSDDLGATWTEAPDPVSMLASASGWQPANSVTAGDKTNGYQQPTMLIPVDAGIITQPDTLMAASLQIIRRDTGSPQNEVWRHEYLHTIQYRRQAFQAFAKGPYATYNGGAEIYLQSNRNGAASGNTSAGHEMWIVGTGDNGRSWHNLATIKHPTASSLSMADGIVGVDNLGYMYAYVGLGTTPYIAKFKRGGTDGLTWQY
ncbi:hypothetical protein DKM44_03860 [Deinococcus irradiatisoli]|uniref:Exo-alpha-sialidase n=2 Tax=Deinococcus irradiatisoli TaxID=2202254 RepID=A0A2Z3JKN3_9DEIO|nr:hypothetical protein DKM44_03860 [Deinococcus irradiatisoli]